MKKYITTCVVSLGLVVCVLLTSGGCQHSCQVDSKNIEKIVFEGEGLNWQVVYTMEGNQQHHDSYFTINYIGEHSSEINHVDYGINGPKEGRDGFFILSETRTYSDKFPLTGDIPGPSDRSIVVTIKWNDQVEFVVLEKIE